MKTRIRNKVIAGIIFGLIYLLFFLILQYSAGAQSSDRRGPNYQYITVIGSNSSEANRNLSRQTSRQNLVVVSRNQSRSGDNVVITAKVRHIHDR